MTWKDIPGWEGWYQASVDGRIRSVGRVAWDGRCLKGKELSQCLHHDYLCVRLCRYGVPCTVDVHGLVASTFIGPRPNGMDTCHRDDDRLNNSVSNLCYKMHGGNMHDARINGCIVYGERHPNAKLTEREVEEIRECNETHERIAVMYRVSVSTIGRIKRREGWVHT